MYLRFKYLFIYLFSHYSSFMCLYFLISILIYFLYTFYISYQLFTGGPIQRPAALEEELKMTCPELSDLIVCVADRVIYRQSLKHPPFLL